VQQIKGKVRTAMLDGKPVPKMKLYNVRDALLKRCCTAFPSTLPWSLSGKKTATGAALSRSIAA